MDGNAAEVRAAGPARHSRRQRSPHRQGGPPEPGTPLEPADRRLGRRRTLLLSTAVAAVVTAVYVLFSVRQWARFVSPSWDQGIFTQLMRAYAELRAPIVPIKGEGFMLLGDHFHPLLVVFAPLYAIWPSGLTLLIAQAVCMGLSAAVLAGCAITHLGKLAGAGIALAYGFSWGIQSAVASQFHEVALALPLLAASCAALIRGRHGVAVAWALPLLGVKEDLGLTVAMIGVVIAIRGSRWLGAGVLAGGVAAFWLTTAVILPALNPDGVWHYAQDSLAAQLLADPVAAVTGMGSGAPEKALLVLMVFAITGGLALVSPIALLMLPTLAWRLTSDVPYHWGTHWHYSAILMVIVFAAAIDALVRRRRLRNGAATAGVTMLGIAVVISAWFPLHNLIDPDYYRPSPQHDGAVAALTQIGDDAVVISDITLLAYLVPTNEVYWLNSPGAPTPDYVVINTRSGVHGADPPRDIVDFATSRYGDHGWVEVLDRDGFLVAQRGEAG